MLKALQSNKLCLEVPATVEEDNDKRSTPKLKGENHNDGKKSSNIPKRSSVTVTRSEPQVKSVKRRAASVFKPEAVVKDQDNRRSYLKEIKPSVLKIKVDPDNAAVAKSKGETGKRRSMSIAKGFEEKTEYHS